MQHKNIYKVFEFDLADSRDQSTGSKLRRRLTSPLTEDEDLDALLKYNRNMQETIAENMILMTSSMKEHALTASSIIKKDINLLEKSDQLTDKNAMKLKTESLKLEEHTKSTWRCWVWLVVAFVLVVFFSKCNLLTFTFLKIHYSYCIVLNNLITDMVLFMKMAKKKP